KTAGKGAGGGRDNARNARGSRLGNSKQRVGERLRDATQPLSPRSGPLASAPAGRAVRYPSRRRVWRRLRPAYRPRDIDGRAAPGGLERSVETLTGPLS